MASVNFEAVQSLATELAGHAGEFEAVSGMITGGSSGGSTVGARLGPALEATSTDLALVATATGTEVRRQAELLRSAGEKFDSAQGATLAQMRSMATMIGRAPSNAIGEFR